MASPRLLRFKKIHYFWIPIIALIVWWGMLIAMLSCWSLQGQPIYAFMGGVHQDPVYISDVGATNLQPLFISCAGFQAIFFVGTLVMEYYLRTHRKLQPYVSRRQPKFAIASIICATIGQLGIIFVSIFNTNSFHQVHISMVGIFIAFCFFACVFNFVNSFYFGNYPQKLSPDHEKVIFGKQRWANLYMVSFWLKCFWLAAAFSFAICFGTYMRDGENSRSAIFEWTISFWYGVLLVMWAIDLFPSAVKHYRSRHPELYPNQVYGLHDEKVDQGTISAYGSPTYVPDYNQSFGSQNRPVPVNDLEAQTLASSRTQHNKAPFTTNNHPSDQIDPKAVEIKNDSFHESPVSGGSNYVEAHPQSHHIVV
ncbi:uncharacterized protein PRCAT00003640001 [Priceomyces carsonii]|uniref:uncharacterized protein n=1 Tax=Priceomyces carsonii TaxID=28549 RepID=UPI002EDA6360|nr:unnamed protein product [Priceomyces carsonii]